MSCRVTGLWVAVSSSLATRDPAVSHGGCKLCLKRDGVLLVNPEYYFSVLADWRRSEAGRQDGHLI
jgi:hypothetical protein